MDETQIRKWLGVPQRERLAPWLVEGLADVPPPREGDIPSHIRVYEAFLESVPLTAAAMLRQKPAPPGAGALLQPWARCRHGKHDIKQLPSGIWVDAAGWPSCVKGGLWRDPLTAEVCQRPAVNHEPMPETGQ